MPMNFNEYDKHAMALIINESRALLEYTDTTGPQDGRISSRNERKQEMSVPQQETCSSNARFSTRARKVKRNQKL